MKPEELKRILKKVWYFIWEDDSVWSWLVNIMLSRGQIGRHRVMSEVLVDRNGYPTELALAKLSEVANKTSWSLERVKELVEFLRQVWWHPEMGVEFSEDGESWGLWLHTLGWSGNEELIGVLSETLFWAIYWQVHKRGGHYYFSNSSELEAKGEIP